MLDIKQLQELQAQSNLAISVMEKANSGVNDLIAEIEKDSSRSQAYKSEKIKAKREAILPILQAQLAVVRNCHKAANASKKYWDSKPLLLSLEKYLDDPAGDAAIKLQKSAELVAMTPPMLHLTFENAIDEVNLPLVYQCWLIANSAWVAGDKRFIETANLPAELEIPNQKAALAAISVCWSNLSHGESVAATASGARLAPSQKITVGREQQITSRFIDAAA